MKYGENSSLVEEVLSEVGNMQLFKAREELLEGIIAINDFEKAQYFAYEYDEFEKNGEKQYTWSDIRELEMSDVYSLAYKRTDYKSFTDNLYGVNELIEKSLYIDPEYEIVWDDVYSDLINCAKTRAIQGKDNKFFEKIFEVYKAGGWPCGWEGNYAMGKLIAYFPAK
jgi:hypothetical protein